MTDLIKVNAMVQIICLAYHMSYVRMVSYKCEICFLCFCSYKK